MIRVGLIGRGTIAGSHENAYRHIQKDGGELVIAAYCDIRPERLEGLGDARIYTDIDEFLKNEQGKLDYADICLPTYLHAETAVKALHAGFNVLSEKPMALDPEQADSMVRAAKETGRQLMVAHCCRFMGAVRVVRGLMESGELGKVRSAEFFREGGSKNPMGYQNWFRDVSLSGGAMLDLHIHDVDVINWLFGMPKAVSAAAANVIPGGGYDAMSVNFLYENGVFVNAKSDWTIAHDRFNTRSMRFNFEKGYVFLDRSPKRGVFVRVDEDGTETDLWDKVDADMYYNEIRYYIDCLENHRPVSECPPEQSAEAVRIIMAEMKSADLGGERVAL